jgi:3-deoxy-manno-octulosonate cytidylyltransferase (CMP-KDO synthetase)
MSDSILHAGWQALMPEADQNNGASLKYKEPLMAIVGIIPARFSSTRYPGKPLVEVHGKPMIRHVYERARQCRRLDRLIVATDDSRILDAVRSFGGEALLTRSDHATGTDRIAETCKLLGLGPKDLVLNIQGDEPLIQSIMIDGLIDAIFSTPDVSMATLAFMSRDRTEYLDPNVVKVVVDTVGRALYFSRSPIPCRRDPDSEPVTFLKHLGFYIYWEAFLQVFTGLQHGALEKMERLEQLRVLEHGYGIQVALSPVETHGVDTPEDLQRVLPLLR